MKYIEGCSRLQPPKIGSEESLATTNMNDVEIPQGTEWLTLKEGAAYARKEYSLFLAAVRSRELPAYGQGPTLRGARVKKREVDEWLESSPY